MTLNERVAQIKDDNRCAMFYTTMHRIKCRLRSLTTVIVTATAVAKAVLNFQVELYGLRHSLPIFVNHDLFMRFSRKKKENENQTI